MLCDTAKKFLHPYRGSGRSVLSGCMAGQNRHLPVAKRMGLDCRTGYSGCSNHSSHPIAPPLQGYPLLAPAHLFHRTEVF